MVIYNLYILCISADPDKTNTPLIVDANAVLTCPISLQGFQSVARRHSEAVEAGSSMNLQQFP